MLPFDYASPDEAERALWAVPNGWRSRIDSVLACPDNAHIPRVPEAGQLQGGFMTMHNGIRVSALGYYGAGMMNMLAENRGVHEPQEERVFAEVLRHLPANSTMLELGAYWAFYSLWFAEKVAHPQCFLVEPSTANLWSGKANFRHAGHLAVFVRAFVGASARRPIIGTPTITVDTFCRNRGIERLSILHSDVQGAEADMLRGAQTMLAAGRIDYPFISTHTDDLHRECIQLLSIHDYVIIACADMQETYSEDGLIVAKHRSIEWPGEIAVSRKQLAR